MSTRDCSCRKKNLIKRFLFSVLVYDTHCFFSFSLSLSRTLPENVVGEYNNNINSYKRAWLELCFSDDYFCLLYSVVSEDITFIRIILDIVIMHRL